MCQKDQKVNIFPETDRILYKKVQIFIHIKGIEPSAIYLSKVYAKNKARHFDTL